MTAKIVIFANSVKDEKHCVAGKRSDGSWVRLVSDPAGSALSTEQQMVTNPFKTFSASPLQIIVTKLTQHVPLLHQPENFTCEYGWQQAYSIKSEAIPLHVDVPETIWGLGRSVSAHAILRGEVKIEQSLYLLKVDELTLYWNDYKRPRAKFSYRGLPYDLPCTDPRFRWVETGKNPHTGHLCISLATRHTDNQHYKVVATIL